jgi:hypothetical protein
MLDQRRLAIQYDLPQYVGSTPTVPAASSASTGVAPPATPPAAEDSSWEILEVGSRVTEQNTTWWKYAWRVSVKNNGTRPIVVRASVELLDSGGYIVDEGDSEATPIRPGETVELTGFELVTANVAGNIAKTSAKVRRVQ